MTLSAIEIFMLGWNEYRRRRPRDQIHRWDEPTDAEILQLIRDHEPEQKGPPYDVSEMKEYPVG
jgi:hypothetical protein